MIKTIGKVSLMAILVASCSQGNDSSTGGNGNVGGANLSGGTSSVGSSTSSNNATGKGGATTSSSAKSNGGSTSGSDSDDKGGEDAGGNTATSNGTGSGGKTSTSKSSSGGDAGESSTDGNGGATSQSGSTKGGTKSAGGTKNAGGSGTAKTGGTSSGAGASSTDTTAKGGSGGCVKPEMPAASSAKDVVNGGKLITFNDDGGWCWYQDERVIVDPEANKLVIGSVAIRGSRNGQVDVSMYDLASGGTPTRSTLGKLNPDDHNAPGLIKVSKDKYVAVYTTHNDDCFSYYNIYENGKWGSQNKFDWSSFGCPTPNSKTVSYSNLWQMPGKIFNFVRSVETSPNLITTTDGAKWEFAGRLSSTPRVGYVAGYYKYWGNNVDRIDFLATEAHPRDEDNSLYHGYVKDGKSYDSTGKQVGEVSVASKGGAPDITKFTKVFATGTALNGATLIHMWNHDITRYEDGTIVATGQGRADKTTDDPDKRFIYMRFDGKQWKSTYLVRGGKKLYGDEQDYTGLSAVHPNDPNTIYVSTTYDPRDDKTQLGKHEIWRGTTCDNGATFSWTPITQNSSQDNLRPVVPYWEGGKTALLWEKGNYITAQKYETSVVGIIMDGS